MKEAPCGCPVSQHRILNFTGKMQVKGVSHVAQGRSTDVLCQSSTLVLGQAMLLLMVSFSPTSLSCLCSLGDLHRFIPKKKKSFPQPDRFRTPSRPPSSPPPPLGSSWIQAGLGLKRQARMALNLICLLLPPKCCD